MKKGYAFLLVGIIILWMSILSQQFLPLFIRVNQQTIQIVSKVFQGIGIIQILFISIGILTIFYRSTIEKKIPIILFISITFVLLLIIRIDILFLNVFLNIFNMQYSHTIYVTINFIYNLSILIGFIYLYLEMRSKYIIFAIVNSILNMIIIPINHYLYSNIDKFMSSKDIKVFTTYTTIIGLIGYVGMLLLTIYAIIGLVGKIKGYHEINE